MPSGSQDAPDAPDTPPHPPAHVTQWLALTLGTATRDLTLDEAWLRRELS